jgi:hypothetical protein
VRRLRRSDLLFTIVLFAAIASTVGCTAEQPSSIVPGRGASQATESAAPTQQATVAPEPDYSVNEPSDPVPLPRDPIAYARALGGTSHKGKTLYFVVGASVASEREAQALLDDSDGHFGDMQSYMIVQQSQSFEGMEPGYWVVLEAYLDYPSAENLQFCRRAFPEAYVKKATVLTSDPIPVYEEIVE